MTLNEMTYQEVCNLQNQKVFAVLNNIPATNWKTYKEERAVPSLGKNYSADINTTQGITKAEIDSDGQIRIGSVSISVSPDNTYFKNLLEKIEGSLQKTKVIKNIEYMELLYKEMKV